MEWIWLWYKTVFGPNNLKFWRRFLICIDSYLHRKYLECHHFHPSMVTVDHLMSWIAMHRCIDHILYQNQWNIPRNWLYNMCNLLQFLPDIQIESHYSMILVFLGRKKNVVHRFGWYTMGFVCENKRLYQERIVFDGHNTHTIVSIEHLLFVRRI